MDWNSLTLVENSSNGVTVRCIPPDSFNCVEFRYRSNTSIDVLIAPWVQFESVVMREWRLTTAREIVRRSLAYERLIKEVELLQKQVESQLDTISDMEDTKNTTFRMWKEDRSKAGMPDDFSDIKDWPPEMMSGYRKHREV